MKMLRFPFYLMLCLGLLAYTGCDDDDDEQIVESLSYDTAPFSAPNTQANMFAAYFPADVVNQFAGRQLDRVSVDITVVPPSTRVYIFAEGTDTRAPGDTLYRADITQRVNTPGEIIHRLDTPLTLSNTGIWIAIETDIPRGPLVQSISCDDGTRYNPNGDRLRVGNNWTSFREVTGSQTVNWNIRGLIAPR